MAAYRRTQEIEHEIGPDGRFSLAVTSADVRLISRAGGSVHVSATFEVHAGSDAEADKLFDAYQMRVDAGQGMLAVADRNDNNRGFGPISRFFGADTVELTDVEVQAPPDSHVEVRVVSGDVQGTGFVGDQRFRSVSGDLRLVESGGELDIDSVSGDVLLRAVGPISLKVNNVSGDLSSEAPLYRHLRAQSVSGDISLDGSFDPGSSHTIDTVSGDCRLALVGEATVAVRGLSSDVHSSLPHRLEGSSDRRRLIVGGGATAIAFNSMSGDIDVTSSRQAPTAPVAPTTTPAPPTAPAITPDQQVAILEALERGEIDVDEAMRQLDGDR